jgi:Sec-independent protein translocase protein TatA
VPGFIGPLELILGGLVALLLFGPKGLGLAARAGGKAVRDVKAAKREVVESVTVDRKALEPPKTED